MPLICAGNDHLHSQLQLSCMLAVPQGLAPQKNKDLSKWVVCTLSGRFRLIALGSVGPCIRLHAVGPSSRHSVLAECMYDASRGHAEGSVYTSRGSVNAFPRDEYLGLGIWALHTRAL